MKTKAVLAQSLLPFAITIAACGGGEPPPPATPASPPADAPASMPAAGGPAAGACGMALYTKEWEPKCQSVLDGACCNEERACGADAGCVKIIACINACPSPRKDACVNGCATQGEKTPGYAALDTLAGCTKSKNVGCPWPTGGGH
ncbi:MAG: hypothetical protein JWM74_1272 [Myxococcaceae bacterium]|nr:hypothetical protein [Myxococcaceae bacterium]